MELTLRNSIHTTLNKNNIIWNNKKLDKSVEKTATKTQTHSIPIDTERINISHNLSNDIKEKEKRSIEIQNGINILNTADHALEKTSDQIHIIKELTIQANNELLTKEEKEKVFEEIKEHINNINNIASSAKYNKIKLLEDNKTELTININENENLNIKKVLHNARADALGLKKDLTTETESKSLINTVDNALKIINSQRSEIGAYQNKLNSNIKPVEASDSKITTPDIAALSADIAKENILQKTQLNITMQLNTNHSMALNLLAA